MKLLTRHEVAEVLGIKVRTLDKWRKEGRAPEFIKVNGAIRCREEDLEKWIDEKSDSDTLGSDNPNPQ